jgi:hypothetical protein
MNNKAQRKIGLLLLGVSTAAIAISVPPMVTRIRAHTASLTPPLWQGETFGQTGFEHLGNPFSITTVELAPGDDRPGAEVVIRYGEDETRLLTQGLDDPRLPGLDRHRYWLQIIAFSQASDLASPEEAILANPGGVSDTDAWRIVVVARRPTTVRDPDEWKAVRAKDWKQWSYTFIELTETGLVRTDELYTDLDGSSWQFFAASIVTPGVFKDASRALSVLNYPNYQGVHGVIDEMGWTWAAVGVEAMVFVLGGLMALLSFGSKGHVDRAIAAHAGAPPPASPKPV